jgi:hypothetical protein
MTYNWAAYANTMTLPYGTIVLWYGNIASIPDTWVLCDGNNGTPDLRDVFVIGANQDGSGTAKTNITGSLTATGGATTVTLGVGTDIAAGTDLAASGSIVPPYYALVYMMKV